MSRRTPPAIPVALSWFVRLQQFPRTGAALLLVVLAATDVLSAGPGLWPRVITALQAALFIGAAIVAPRTIARGAGSSRSAVRRGAFYNATLMMFGALCGLQKCWIAATTAGHAWAAYRHSYQIMGALMTFATLLLLMGRSRRLNRYFVGFAKRPARQTATSFVALSLLGATLLCLPICVRDPSRVAFVDALFMATSAVCVTGLAVHDIAHEYTLWGQGVLLALVQVGGLGIMVLSASLVVLSGRRLKAHSSVALVEVLDADSLSSLRGGILRIVGFTLAIEALGTALLWTALSAYPEVALDISSNSPRAGAGGLFWSALFHAVSAFCNAGFTLTSASLQPFAASYGVCSTVMALIVLGGLGFPVLSELAERVRARIGGARAPNLSLHARVVLLSNAVLLVGVTLVFVLVEWRASLGGHPWFERVFTAAFQSVTLRTAGFSTIDFSACSGAGLMSSMMVMFIGASPGGTGGGLKTTTFAVLFATLRAELSNAPDAFLLDRRLPAVTVRRAISVAFVAAIVVTLSIFALLLFERAEPLRLAFEAVSAFATVGLSADVTPSLSSAGKVTLIVTMLIGRVGPLTVALATSERARGMQHLYPHERVLIG